MSRTSLIISILVLGATIANARTFNPAPYLAEAEVDVLTRDVANQMVQRDLFGSPYATAVPRSAILPRWIKAAPPDGCLHTELRPSGSGLFHFLGLSTFHLPSRDRPICR